MIDVLTTFGIIVLVIGGVACMFIASILFVQVCLELIDSIIDREE